MIIGAGVQLLEEISSSFEASSVTPVVDRDDQTRRRNGLLWQLHGQRDNYFIPTEN